MSAIAQSWAFAPLARAWHFRELIRAVVRRELAVRFRGSILGWLWAIFGPLIMLLLYTVVFSNVAGVPKSAQAGGVKVYALSIFCGLTVFNFFSELAARAPALLHEHAHYIKKSIFPSETLSWIATLRAMTYAGISLALLIFATLVVTYRIPPTVLLLPFIVIPFALFMLGISWFLMALGSFTRDVSHLMASIIPVFMFATPIFYTVDDAPARVRFLVHLNIIGNFTEMIRDVLIHGQPPDLTLYVVSSLVAYVVFLWGYNFFMRYKSVFVDVL